jgi:hypothetical protein
MSKAWLLSALDRAVRTAIQVVAGYLVAAQAGGALNWGVVGLAAGLAVLVSLLQSAVDFPVSSGNWWMDVAGRALRTYAQAALASVGAAVLLTDVNWATVLTASAAAALASVVTSVFATPLGSVSGSPALVRYAPLRQV